eukprot:5197351-Pleurochrysis_carterae.AAC.1
MSSPLHPIFASSKCSRQPGCIRRRRISHRALPFRCAPPPCQPCRPSHPPLPLPSAPALAPAPPFPWPLLPPLPPPRPRAQGVDGDREPAAAVRHAPRRLDHGGALALALAAGWREAGAREGWPRPLQ